MPSISADDLRKAFAKAATACDPKAAARAADLIRQSTENLDLDDTSARATVQRGITEDTVNRDRGN